MGHYVFEINETKQASRCQAKLEMEMRQKT